MSVFAAQYMISVFHWRLSSGVIVVWCNQHSVCLGSKMYFENFRACSWDHIAIKCQISIKFISCLILEPILYVKCQFLIKMFTVKTIKISLTIQVGKFKIITLVTSKYVSLDIIFLLVNRQYPFQIFKFSIAITIIVI